MLRLRPYKKCDADKIVSWIGDEVAFRKWSADRFETYPISGADLNAHYDEFAETDSFFQMTAFDESGQVGHMIMRFLDEEQRLLRFGFIIVDSSKRGKGYGKEMLKLAIQFAFEILKVEQISIGVFDNNPPAIHCYTSLGFREMTTGSPEYYTIMGEQWKCLMLELNNNLHP